MLLSICESFLYAHARGIPILELQPQPFEVTLTMTGKILGPPLQGAVLYDSSWNLVIDLFTIYAGQNHKGNSCWCGGVRRQWALHVFIYLFRPGQIDFQRFTGES